jgi:hypothetical protein
MRSDNLKVGISLFGTCATQHTDLGRWRLFVEKSSQYGFQLTAINDLDSGTYIAIDHSPSQLRKIKKKIPKKSRLLVLREGPVVRPDQFRRSTIKKYGYLISAGRMPRASIQFTSYQDGFLPSIISTLQHSARRANSICIVNTNKFSLHRNSNYSLRQKAIKCLVQTGFDVTVAGSGWDFKLTAYLRQQLISCINLLIRRGPIHITQFRFPLKTKISNKIKFLGFVEDHHNLLSSHEFALVIENDNFRITEKLFDAVIAGCIPVYFGPNFDETDVPSQMLFRIPDQSDLKSCFEVARNLSKERRLELREIGQNWLMNSETKLRWSLDESMDDLWRAIRSFTDQNRHQLDSPVESLEEDR